LLIARPNVIIIGVSDRMPSPVLDPLGCKGIDSLNLVIPGAAIWRIEGVVRLKSQQDCWAVPPGCHRAFHTIGVVQRLLELVQPAPGIGKH